LKSLGLNRYALALGVAAALLAGCGVASQSFAPAGSPSVAQHRGIAGPIRSDASKKGLLYISTLDNGLEMYAWPSLAPVGFVSAAGVPLGLCVDATGDIWVPMNDSLIWEFAHGGYAPIRQLLDNYGLPGSCSSDPTTGNLAAGSYFGASSGPGNVLVYKKARRGPAVFALPDRSQCFSVAYDSEGNLFANGIDANGRPILAELSKGKRSFERVSVPLGVGRPGSLQWDGKYLAEQDADTNVIYQFKVSNAVAIIKGLTMLQLGGYSNQLWITGGTKRHPQGTAVIGTNYAYYGFSVWKYPSGGDPQAVVYGVASSPEGVTVSPDKP
jgi:hypothetical protein